MARVGGAYKRRIQLCGFIIGLIIAAGLNVNAINIGKTLWRQPMLVKEIAPQKDPRKYGYGQNPQDAGGA